MGSLPHVYESPDERWLWLFAMVGAMAVMMIAAHVIDRAFVALGRLIMGRKPW